MKIITEHHIGYLAQVYWRIADAMASRRCESSYVKERNLFLAPFDWYLFHVFDLMSVHFTKKAPILKKPVN